MGNYPRFTDKDMANQSLADIAIKPLEVQVEELKAVINYVKELMIEHGILDGEQK